jgi:hypothetical protein
MQDKHIQIILHAGAHKTASTRLQNRLLENEHLFAKTGCSYLGPERIRDEFGTLWRALGRSDSPAEQKIKLAALAAGRSRLLISEENIIGGFKDLMSGPNRAMIYPKALERLTRWYSLLHPIRCISPWPCGNLAPIMYLSTINCCFQHGSKPGNVSRKGWIRRR